MAAMTTLDDYGNAEFWAASGWIAPWLKEVGPDYWREMIPCLGDNIFRRKAGWRDFVLTDTGRERLRIQLCTRISQASDVFVPWLEQAIAMKGLRVLEIGCGSGSSTAGLAHAGAHVTGVDIKNNALIVARRRLSLLGLEAAFVEAAPDWLRGEVDVAGFAGPYDLVVCYAMLEHLEIDERLNLLQLARRIMARDGALLATFETPNRFAPFDWHSSKLAFTDVLPDDLAFAYAKTMSDREGHPAKRREIYDSDARTHLYRAGRGVSWHEFALAFGMENLEVLLDGYSPRSQQKNYKADETYEAALANVFANLAPPVARGFCRPSLELLLKLAQPEAA
jgi:SAM-dependent methyltransferase